VFGLRDRVPLDPRVHLRERQRRRQHPELESHLDIAQISPTGR